MGDVRYAILRSCLLSRARKQVAVPDGVYWCGQGRSTWWRGLVDIHDPRTSPFRLAGSWARLRSPVWHSPTYLIGRAPNRQPPRPLTFGSLLCPLCLFVAIGRSGCAAGLAGRAFSRQGRANSRADGILSGFPAVWPEGSPDDPVWRISS